MRILIAPDSFKGSVSSSQFCDIAEEAIMGVNQNIEVVKMPMADGGEGIVDAIVRATGGSIIEKTVKGPLDTDVKACFGVTGDGTTGIVELASASGLTLVPAEDRNPLYTTTYGTGQLFKEALHMGCRRIIIGLGGSSTNDGAVGLLSALGIRFKDKDGKQISPDGKGLLELETIEASGMDKRLENVEVIAACDVENPLYGENGASYVYGPQKGATREIVKLLDEGLIRYSDIIKKQFNLDIAFEKGAGAAGGAAAGVMAFLKARLIPGTEIVMEYTGLKRIFEKKAIDLVITGEGEMNYQTAFGKLPVRVAAEAKKHKVPVVAIVGKIGEGAYELHGKGIDAIFSITNGPMPLEEAMKSSSRLLFDAIGEVVRLYGMRESVRK